MKELSFEFIEDNFNAFLDLHEKGQENALHTLGKTNPGIIAYLFDVGNDLLNADEREHLIFSGLIVWWILNVDNNELPKVSADELDTATDANTKVAETLAIEVVQGGTEALDELIETYYQPFLLELVADLTFFYDAEEENPETVNDEDGIRDEIRPILFIFLKSIIDCLEKNDDK